MRLLDPFTPSLTQSYGRQLTTFHALLLHHTKIDIVLGVAAWRRHGKQRTRQLHRKTRRNRLRVEEFLSSLNTLYPDRRKRARIRWSEATRRIEFGIVQRSNEINQWLHHVLDLPCWSNWWPPSSIVRINSLTITNVTLRVYNYLEHCFHEDRLPSLDELISCQSIVISTRLFLSIQIHKISRSCLDVTRIFYIASRNFVALDRFSTLFLLFIFIFFSFFSSWRESLREAEFRREGNARLDRGSHSLVSIICTSLPPKLIFLTGEPIRRKMAML